MKNDELIIDGLNNFDVLQLKEELAKNEIASEKKEVKQVSTEPGKNFEFVSTAILVVNISIVALKVIKLWLDTRKKKDQFMKVAMRLKVGNGSIVEMNQQGQIIRILFSDGTLMEAPEFTSEKLKENLETTEGITETVKSILEVFKDS